MSCALLLYECAFAGKAKWREHYLCLERCEIAEAIGIEGVFDDADAGCLGHEWADATGGMETNEDAENVEGGVGTGDLGPGVGGVLHDVFAACDCNDDGEIGADDLFAGNGGYGRTDEEEEALLLVGAETGKGAIDVAAKVFCAFGENGETVELGEAGEALGD
jgi:hypothetical protein